MSTLQEWISKGLKDVLVDFDHTICSTDPGFFMGPPIDGVRDALTEIQQAGLRVVVWSSRTARESGKSEGYIEQELRHIGYYMSYWHLPYDEIDDGTHGKRFALAYIDDRGVAFEGKWEPVLRRVMALKEAEDAQN